MLSRIARVAPRVAVRQVATYNPHHNKIAAGVFLWITATIYWGTARPYLQDELWEQKSTFSKVESEEEDDE
ncbi:Oidioi.mRNA.OKI2018_I69.chr2.g6856.t1.cds [Oikopleura dioica]|uniref:Oidioi.mRNA.OKI2018_I69.chr2.g6856.t1.cds n=1 Tax=Oikopleura dioica TaxID=34765 RepID=A0ABN7T4S2_OIKDI|nr:Oidioi.mRNA.OKI2018_I69.chr2.g6856.t1.cds [Oikopleura dioica]